MKSFDSLWNWQGSSSPARATCWQDSERLELMITTMCTFTSITWASSVLVVVCGVLHVLHENAQDYCCVSVCKYTYTFTDIHVCVCMYSRWVHLQVCLHERCPSVHQEVTDAPLTGGGGLMEGRVTSERHKHTTLIWQTNTQQKRSWSFKSTSGCEDSRLSLRYVEVGCRHWSNETETFHQWQ